MFFKIPQIVTFHPQTRLMTVRLMKYTYIRFSVLSRVILGRSILHFAPTPFQKQRKNTRRATSRTVWAESLQNFAEFLPLHDVDRSGRL